MTRLNDLITLVRSGSSALLEALQSGELKGRDVRVAVRGFAKYATALATGHIATDDEQAKRLAICDRCNIVRPRPITNGQALYCGEPFADKLQQGMGCGCLVAIRVNGDELSPAGKTEVSTERCPLGRW